jgi:hypothetical protein
MPTNAKRLAKLLVKFDRAKSHISETESTIRAFLDAKPYVVSTKRDPQSRRLIYYLSSVQEPPDVLSTIVGDALQNLRSTLDHLAWQLVEANGQKPTRDTSFPIFKDSISYQSGRSTKVTGMSVAVIQIIDGLKPYAGGNADLYRLHELNNIDKHRLLLTVGSGFQSVNLAPHMQRIMEKSSPTDWPAKNLDLPDLFVRPADRLVPLKAEDELFIDGPDAEVNEKIQFRFDIAFAEAPVHGEPVLPILNQLANLVEEIVTQFKPHL